MPITLQNLAWEGAWQHDHRQGIPGSVGVQVDLSNILWSGNLRWIFEDELDNASYLGASATQKGEKTNEVEVLVPNSATTDGSIYYVQSYRWNRQVLLSGGVRGDYRRFLVERTQMTGGLRVVQAVNLRGQNLDSIPPLIVEGSARAATSAE